MPETTYKRQRGNALHCGECGLLLSGGESSCPRCHLAFSGTVADEPPQPPTSVPNAEIARLLRQQQTGWWIFIIGLVITFLAWFVCR